jgi:hypothetical protein
VEGLDFGKPFLCKIATTVGFFLADQQFFSATAGKNQRGL